MRDYNIDEAREIMKNHHHNDLVITSHFEERCLYRKLDINYIVNCLLNEIPLSISKTTNNRFKLIYPHETKSSMDLYVIIEIDENCIVKLITAYSNNRGRREREQ